jgi:hypothetical protein
MLLINIIMVAYAGDKSSDKCDFIIYNKCISCDTPYTFEVGFDKNCIEICPNRDTYTIGTGYYSHTYCFLKQCPTDRPYRSNDSSCYEDEGHVPNWKNKYKGFYDMFLDDDIREQTEISANNNQCSPQAPLFNNGKCFSCNETKNLPISEDECRKCSNRKYIYSKQWNHGECVLPCPDDKPLKRWDGKCFSCDEKKVVSLETWCNFDINCDVCPNRTIIYGVGGNIPSILNCPTDKPLMDAHGTCYSCETRQYVDVRWNSDICEKNCSNRYLNDLNDSCILKGMKFEPNEK